MRMRFLLCLFYVCLEVMGSSVVHAEGDESGEANLSAAREKFYQGNTLFEERQYTEAADAFRAANKIKPNWKLWYNIAQSEAAAKRHGFALTAFERYLSLGGDDIDATRQKEVTEEISRLKKMVGYVSIEAPEGAMIVLDDVECGTAPLAGGIPVAGSVVHAVEVTLVNGETLPSQKVSLVSGNTIDVSFLPKETSPDSMASKQSGEFKEPAEPASAESIPRGADDTRLKRLKHIGWALSGVGAAVLVGAAVTGGLALSTQKEIDEKCPGEGCYESDYHLVNERDNLALTTDVLLGVGGTIFAVGAGFLIYSFSKGRKERGSDQIVFVQPMVNVDIVGASVELRF